MKRAGHLFMVLMAFTTMTLGAQGCHGNEDEPDMPKDIFRIYNEKDSAAFCEVLKTAYGDGIDQICKQYNMKLDSVPSWPWSIVIWEAFDNLPQKRITGLNLWSPAKRLSEQQNENAASSLSNISPAIWEMDSLQQLILSGNLFQGEFPAPDGRGKCLELVYLSDTGITSLPLELFTIPSLDDLQITDAYRLERLPDGFDQIPARPGKEETRRLITNSALFGIAPIECALDIHLYNNNYTEMDWEALKRIDVASRLVERHIRPAFSGIILDMNRLSGTIPAEVLADTLRLIYLHNITYPQQKGYGFSNMPDTDELRLRKDEYCTSHPEIAPLLSRLIIDTVWDPDSSGE